MVKNKRYLIVILMAGLALLFLTVWFTGRLQSKNHPVRIVYIPKVVDEASDFWSSLIEGAEAGAKEYGAQLTIKGASSETDFETQYKIIKETIQEKPDVMVISPISYTESTSILKKAIDSGIKVVFVDSMIDDTMGMPIVATDNYQAGAKLGDFLYQQLPANPVIGVVAHVKESSTAMERAEGLRNGLKKNADNIVDTVYCDSDYQKAYKVTVQMIKDHPDINVIVGLNEYSAVGAARAVKELGMTDQIIMAGFDSSIEEIKLLEEGVFVGIVIQKPFNMGYLGIETGMESAFGEVKTIVRDSGSELITKENMYTEENQKLLFHFRDTNE